MVKRFVALLLAAALFACACLAAFGADFGSAGRRVFDYYNMFSGSEVDALEAAIAAAREETGMDFVVLTGDDAEYSYDDGEAETISMAFADDFYDYNGFGAGAERSGMLFFIDMSNRMPTISTCGEAINIVTDSRLNEMLDAAWDDLSAGYYAASAQSVLTLFRRYCAAGVPEGQYQYDIHTGEQLTAPAKRLTRGEILAAAGGGALVGLIIWIAVSMSYRVSGGTYSYDLASNSEVRVNAASDQYITTQVTRVRKARKSNGGGGGGGFGGGSGVHMSGSGSFHGGGSGHRF